MNNFADWADTHLADEWDGRDAVEHDAYVLASAGWGTDEDYGSHWAGYEDESDMEYAMQFGPFDEMPGDDDYSLADDQWGMTADAFIGGE